MRLPLSIQFKPEFGNELIKEFSADLDSDKLPKSVQGKLVGATADEIIRLEVALVSAIAWHQARRYKFQSLDRDGSFTIVRDW